MLLSADNFCEQFGPRSGLKEFFENVLFEDKMLGLIGSKHSNSIPENFFRKHSFKKKISAGDKVKLAKFASMKRIKSMITRDKYIFMRFI